MIKTVKGDCLSASGIIVHGCNSLGKMGSGIALTIRNKWPGCFAVYRDAHTKAIHSGKSNLQLGDVIWYHANDDQWVANAITQKVYGSDKSIRYCDYEAIKTAFKEVNRFALENGIKDVNFPLIGCGLANGDWKVVSKIIDEALDDSLNKTLYTL